MNKHKPSKECLERDETEGFVIKMLAYFAILTYGFDKLDQGTLPAIQEYILKDYDYDTCSQCIGFGPEYTSYINSINKLGVGIGSLIVSYSFTVIKPRYMLSGSSLITAICFFVFGMASYNSIKMDTSTRYYIMVSCRTVIGVMQAFTAIYPQVFMSVFMDDKIKTFYVALLGATVPIGILIGYGLTSMVFYYHWQIPIFLQAFCQLFFTWGFLMVPERFDLTEENLNKGSKIPGANTFSERMYIIYQKIFTVKEFTLNTFGMCGLFFIVTIIQFQVPYYMTDILHCSKNFTDYTYLINSVFVIMIGVLLGGKLVNLTGGIRSVNALRISLVCCSFASLFCYLFSNTDEKYAFSVFVGGALLFGSAYMPIALTHNLEYLDPNFKTLGNSIYILLTNFLGFLPPNIVYGYLADEYGYKYAMRMTTLASLTPLLGAVLLWYNYDKKSHRHNKEYNLYHRELVNESVDDINLDSNNNKNEGEFEFREDQEDQDEFGDDAQEKVNVRNKHEYLKQDRIKAEQKVQEYVLEDKEEFAVKNLETIRIGIAEETSHSDD